MTLPLRGRRPYPLAAPVPAAPPPPALAVDDHAFAGFQTLIQREAGIWLAPVKRPMLVGRLSRRLRELHLDSYGAYLRLVRADPAERVRMLDCITTNETRFFREERHFALLAEEIYPAWRAQADRGLRPRAVRAWSAACSTGEEPFSLAMSLCRGLPPAGGWSLDVLASDLSTRALEAARSATWAMARQREIPPADLRDFMLRGVGSQEGRMRAGPLIRGLVRFARVNLNEPVYPVGGPFDLVFCRNVLIYFDGPTREAVLGRLEQLLAPGGYLFLGHAESLNRTGTALRPVIPTVYTRAPGARTP